jgi:photosystem II stability/assembly factor-like uncharacterized protein
MTRKSQHHARRTPILATALVAGALSMASQIKDASAHGRVLRTSGIAVGPTRWYQRTPTDWLVATTFGSAVSHDQGQSFHWICDEAVGGMTNFDGIVRVPQKDTLVIGNRNGLFVSRDGGCSFATDPNFAPPAQITAISISAHDPARWYVSVNTPDASQGALWTTQDNAKTFTKLPLPAEHFYLDAVASSEADAQLLVVAGSQNRKSAGSPLWTSRDGGASWTESWVKNAPWAAALPKIALHPKDPSVMLVSWLDVTNNTSYVLRSTDGGKSFAPVLHPPEPTTAVSFADGGHAAFVSGSYHFYVSRDGGARFVQQTHPQGNACMALSQDRIYACGAEGLDAFSMAMRGADDTAWQPVLRLPQLQGPYHCQQGSPVYDACAPLWPAYAQKLGATAQGAP